MHFARAELACPRVESSDVRALALCVLRLVGTPPTRRPFTLCRELELGRASGARAHLGTLRSPVIPSRLPAPDMDGRPPPPAEIANGLCIPVYSSLTLYIFARPQKFRKRPVHGSKGTEVPSSSALRPRHAHSSTCPAMPPGHDHVTNRDVHSYAPCHAPPDTSLETQSCQYPCYPLLSVASATRPSIISLESIIWCRPPFPSPVSITPA